MPSDLNRRHLLGWTALASAGAAGATSAQDPEAIIPASDLPGHWDVDRSIINLDAAYYGAMPRAVHAAYLDHLNWVNRNNSTFLRGATKPTRDEALNASRQSVADLINADLDEIALCSGGTEALYALITNYSDLKPGDAVICADVDYDEMQYAMAYLQESRGARLIRFAMPRETSPDAVLAAYTKILEDTPRAKLLLLTHVSNRNGLIPPVSQIADAARARGVDVILDSAQAVGQLPVDVRELGVDFIGYSLHKWLAAPLGTGGIYIRRGRLGSIAPYMGNGLLPASDVRSRLLTGTINYAAHLSIPDAVAFHRRVGDQAKLSRLRMLRDYWMDRVKDVRSIERVGPQGAAPYGAIGAFRPIGMTQHAEAQRLQARILERHGVLVVAKSGLAAGPVLRVTPALFNTPAELDRLVAAITQEAS